MNIELPENESKGITDVANSLGISVTDLVLKGIKACTQILDLFPIVEKPADPKPIEVDDSDSDTAKASVSIGDKKYSASSWRQLLQDVVSSLGCRKVFDAYPEDRRNVLTLDSPDGKAKQRYVRVEDGRYKFYLLVHFSVKGIKDTLKVIADSLKLTYKEI